METFRELINRHKNKKLPLRNYHPIPSTHLSKKLKPTPNKPPPTPNIIPIKSLTPKEHKKRKLFKDNFIQMLYQIDNISKRKRKSSSLTKTPLITPIYSSTNHYQKHNDNHNNSNSFISNNNSLNHFHNYSTLNLPQNKFKLDTTYNSLSKSREQSIINQSTYTVMNNFNSNNLPFTLNISNDSILWNKLKNKNTSPSSVRDGRMEVHSRENISILEGIGNSNVNSIGNVIGTLNVSSLMKNTCQDEKKNERGKTIKVDNRDDKYSLTKKLKTFNRDLNIINIPKHYLSNSPTMRNNVLNLLEKLNKVTNDKNKNNKSNNVTFKQTKLNNPIKEEDEDNNVETKHNIKPITIPTKNEQQIQIKPTTTITPIKPNCNNISETPETIPSKANTSTTSSPSKPMPYLYIKKKSNQNKQQPSKHNNLRNNDNNIIEISNNKTSRNNFTNIEISPIKSTDDHVIKQQIPFKKATITNLTPIDKYKVNNKLKSRVRIKTNDDLEYQCEKACNKKGRTHKKFNTSDIEETTLHFGTIDSELQISYYKFKESFSLVDKDYTEFEKGINGGYSNNKKLYKKSYLKNKNNSFQKKDSNNNISNTPSVQNTPIKNNQFIYKRKINKDQDSSFSSYKKKSICKSPIVSKHNSNMIYCKKEMPKTERIVKKSSRIREKLINFNKPVTSNSNKHNKESEDESNINEDSKDMIELLEDMKFENIRDESKEHKSKHNVTYSACLYKSDFNFLQDEIITNSLNTSNNELQQNGDENIQRNKDLRYSEDLSSKFNQIKIKSKSPKLKDNSNSYKQCKIKVRHRNNVKINDKVFESKTINSTYSGNNSINKRVGNLKQPFQCKNKPVNSNVVNTVKSKSLDKNKDVKGKQEQIKSKGEISSNREKKGFNLDNKKESKVKQENNEMNNDLKDKQNHKIEKEIINTLSNIKDKESFVKINKNNNDNKNLQQIKIPIDTKIPLDIIEEAGEATESAEDTSRMINERRKELYMQNRFAKLNKNNKFNNRNKVSKEEKNKSSNNATDNVTPQKENKNPIEQITVEQLPTLSKDQKRERANSRIDFEILQLSPIYKPSRNSKLEFTSNNTLHISSKTNISNRYEKELLNYLPCKQQHEQKEFMKFKNKHQTSGNLKTLKQTATTKDTTNDEYIPYQSKKPKRNVNNENTQLNSFQKATPIKPTSLNNSINTTQNKSLLTPSLSSNYIHPSCKKIILKPPTIKKPTTKPSIKIQLIQPNIPKLKPAITVRNKVPITFNQDISTSLDKSIDLLSNPTSYLNQTCNDLLTDKYLTQGLNTSRKQDDSFINIEQSTIKTQTQYQFIKPNQMQKSVSSKNINRPKINQAMNHTNTNNNECILF